MIILFPSPKKFEPLLPYICNLVFFLKTKQKPNKIINLPQTKKAKYPTKTPPKIKNKKNNKTRHISTQGSLLWAGRKKLEASLVPLKQSSQRWTCTHPLRAPLRWANIWWDGKGKGRAGKGSCPMERDGLEEVMRNRMMWDACLLPETWCHPELGCSQGLPLGLWPYCSLGWC